MHKQIPSPKILPPLDENFCPAVLVNRAYQQEVAASGVGEKFVIGLERADGSFSRFETKILPEGHPSAESSFDYVERILKFLLWQRGGWKIYLGGAKSIAEYIAGQYSPTGKRAFDHQIMGEVIYDKTFTIVSCSPEDVPVANEDSKALGRNLDGNRIGFDLGASDLKISAVINGKPVYTEEIVWEPSIQTDPTYHYKEVMAALKIAASKMQRVDAIGGSSAGIFVDNRPRIASLFRRIPKERFGEINSLFIRIRDELGVPLEIINDGDVTALAGAMSLDDNGVLGIAMGSSEAAGYVNLEGNITGWLNELAFAPVDYNPAAPVDDWSGDRGVGALYFSQQCVFRLAPKVGISLPKDVTDAAKLKAVQKELEVGHKGAEKIWQSMGIYLGYTLAHYADFYNLKHVLILGRCTSGRGGQLILDGAQEVLQAEFPDLMMRINIQLPDEKSRRVGQSIAAASLPKLKKEAAGMGLA